MSKVSLGPRFTQAARLAAAAKRRERSEFAALNFNIAAVFALRAPMPDKGYIWELRKFGGLSLKRSELSYPSAAAAREAGQKALTHAGSSFGNTESADGSRLETMK